MHVVDELKIKFNISDLGFETFQLTQENWNIGCVTTHGWIMGLWN